jgi:hypothetical protein
VGAAQRGRWQTVGRDEAAALGEAREQVVELELTGVEEEPEAVVEPFGLGEWLRASAQAAFEPELLAVRADAELTLRPARARHVAFEHEPPAAARDQLTRPVSAARRIVDEARLEAHGVASVDRLAEALLDGRDQGVGARQARAPREHDARDQRDDESGGGDERCGDPAPVRPGASGSDRAARRGGASGHALEDAVDAALATLRVLVEGAQETVREALLDEEGALAGVARRRLVVVVVLVAGAERQITSIELVEEAHVRPREARVVRITAARRGAAFVPRIGSVAHDRASHAARGGASPPAKFDSPIFPWMHTSSAARPRWRCFLIASKPACSRRPISLHCRP